MSQILQTLSYIQPGVYTATVPAGIYKMDVALWGAGGGDGASGPSTTFQSGNEQYIIRYDSVVTRPGQFGTNTLTAAGSRAFSSGSGSFTLPSAVAKITASLSGGAPPPPSASNWGESNSPARTSYSSSTSTAAFSLSSFGPASATNITVTLQLTSNTSWKQNPTLTLSLTKGQSASAQTQKVDRKQFYIRASYDGNNTVSFSGYYSGSSTDSPNGAVYLAAVSYSGGVASASAGTQISVDGQTYSVGAGSSRTEFLNVSRGATINYTVGSGGAVNISWDTVTETFVITPDEITRYPVYGTRPVYTTISGGRGGVGAPGGFITKTIQVTPGDTVTVIVGAPGQGPQGGTGTGLAAQFRGGNSGTATQFGRGGGGGAASAVLVNGQLVAVAAGGGGGAGGTTTDAPAGLLSAASGSGWGQLRNGQDSPNGVTTGGAGGGGFWGGAAGSSGNGAGPGIGGVNFGTTVDVGTGATPGGADNARYPGQQRGRAGVGGAAIVDFVKSFSLRIKQDGLWKNLVAASIKVNGVWKNIDQGWVKVSGSWRPVVSSDVSTITTPTYSLAANVASVDEGRAVLFTLTTANVANATVIPYTAFGVQSVDLQVGSLTGNFVVGTTNTITFVPRLNQTINGQRILTVSLDSLGTFANVIVNDTST